MKSSGVVESKPQESQLSLALCLIVLDHIWMFISASYVRMAIYFSSTPILCDLVRRLTFMSGHSDVNANLCLFLRILYTLLPSADLRFDVTEYSIGQRFLQVQYTVLIWLVNHCGLRILPPPLRPLYISYYGRAIEAMRFVNQAIIEDGIQQIVILGAGFDTTGYRTRALRIPETVEPKKFACHNNFEKDACAETCQSEKVRYVRVYEVDLPSVQRNKIQILKNTFSSEKLAYYTEGVHYLECNFGVDSLIDVLLAGGFDPARSSAFLWEGVTYYLSKEAVDATLSQIRALASMGSRVKPENDAEDGKTVASPFEEYEVSGRPHKVRLLMDYMDQSNTLTNTHSSWLWQLEQRLSHSLGTPFITGFENVIELLATHDFAVQTHKSRDESESMLKKMGEYTSVLFENNSTVGQNEPNLAILTAIFRPKDNN